MKYVILGPTPRYEANVISSDFVTLIHCDIFKQQLRRRFGHEPPHTHFGVKRVNYRGAFDYFTVVCLYMTPDGKAYAHKCKKELPLKWDDVALDTLIKRLS